MKSFEGLRRLRPKS